MGVNIRLLDHFFQSGVKSTNEMMESVMPLAKRVITFSDGNTNFEFYCILSEAEVCKEIEHFKKQKIRKKPTTANKIIIKSKIPVACI